MPLFVLQPQEDLPDDDNPWEPWYDKCFGFVIRAINEKEARKIAQANAGDEKRGEFLNKKTSNTTLPWLDEKYSMCTILLKTGESEIILSDFASS